MAKGKKTGGRKPGSVNKVTADIRALAQVHSSWCMAQLRLLAEKAENEATRLGAVRELLDRGHGKPKQAIDVEGTLHHEGLLDRLALAESAGVV